MWGRGEAHGEAVERADGVVHEAPLAAAEVAQRERVAVLVPRVRPQRERRARPVAEADVRDVRRGMAGQVHEHDDVVAALGVGQRVFAAATHVQRDAEAKAAEQRRVSVDQQEAVAASTAGGHSHNTR